MTPYRSVVFRSGTAIQLIATATVRSQLGESSTADAEIETYINVAQARIEQYLGRKLHQETMQDYFVIPPHKTNQKTWMFSLARRPIVSVSGVTRIAADGTVGEAFKTSDYSISFASYVSLFSAVNAARVRVSYVAGYLAADIPADLSDACGQWAKQLYMERGRDSSINSISQMGDNVGFIGLPMPMQVKEIIDYYRVVLL